MSTAPSDSVSNRGKKNRPGKNARMASRAATQTESNASFFASQISEPPVPQPGKFPVVFRTGVGEPTRDIEFAYDDSSIDEIIEPLAARYTFNPKYAEFSDHSGYTDEFFEADIQRQIYLGLAQQTVHAHVNVGLPLGDFSSIASTDVFLFTGLSAIIRQFGEFTDPSLGTRFLLREYQSTVASLVRAASNTTASSLERARKTLWLPVKPVDKRTTFIVAKRLAGFLELGLRVRLDVGELCGHLFDASWDVFDALKPLLGDENTRDRFDFLFQSYATEVEFIQKFTGAGPQAVLAELNLWWDNPSQPDLSFHLVPKVRFPELVDSWARKRSTIQKFLSCTSGIANRTSASGSQSQVSSVQTKMGITVVETLVALPAPELSLLACFPPSALLSDSGPYNVVVTTSIPLQVRATEFLQGDWVG